MSKKITILSMSAITVLAGAAVSPALGAIGEHFTDASPLLIGLIVSLPAIFIAFSSALTGKLLKYLSFKQAGIIGVTIYIIGGLGAISASSIYVLLGFRAILGIGTGIVLPLSTGLISYYYESDEQKKLMGFSAASNNLGGIIATVLSGFLIAISWQSSFLVYLVGLIPLILIILFLPNDRIRQTSGSTKVDKKIVIPIYLMTFLNMMTFFIFPTNFSRIFTIEGFIQPTLLGIVMSANTIVAFFIGMIFYKILSKFKHIVAYIYPLAYLAGYILSYIAEDIFVAILSSALLGIGAGLVMPFINVRISQKVPRETVTATMATNGFFMFIGQFVTPFMISALEIFNTNVDIRYPFLMGAGLSILLLLINTQLKFIKD